MVDAVIMFLIGLFFTALGYRVIGPRSGANPSHEPKHVKAERFYRVAGPVVLSCGAIIALIRLVS